MRLRSFSTVVIRIIGMMTIVFGILMMLYIGITLFVLTGFGPETRFPGYGSMVLLQFLLPVLMVIIGVILISASRALSNSICSGLEE